MAEQRPCPCGDSQAYLACCGRYHTGTPAPTPEALMRSRYTAFALQLHDYLLATWHPSTRPASLSGEESAHWVRLEVLESGDSGEQGHVHFRATFREGRRWSVLEEASRFLREAGHWYYLDGSPSVARLKPGRNDRCLCGSGRKFKTCCGMG